MAGKTRFTQSQQDVINQIDGRVIVVACPGSGKTTTMLERINHMIESGIPPERILMVTFTKAAAEEMEVRFSKKYFHVGTVFSTIHSLCFNVLRRQYNFNASSILKEWETYKFIRDYFKDDVDYHDLDKVCKAAVQDISYVKNAKIPPEKYNTGCVVKRKPVDFPKLFKAYENYKKQVGKIDFDDMLLLCEKEFRENKEVLEFWQDYFPYIIIDEFQDTNIVQSEIFYMLAKKHGNLCIVGDDDQSIYGFRSADSSIMLDFKNRFPDAKEYRLDVNYRSGKKIIEEAGSLIANNKVRFDKKFEAAAKTDGTIEKIPFSNADSTKSEYVLLMNKIREAHKNGVPYDDMAVLYRINRLATPVIAALMNENIPFYVRDAVQDIHSDFLYQDVLSYYRLAHGIADGRDFMKILNHPGRYLKKADFEGCDFDEDALLLRCDVLSSKNRKSYNFQKQQIRKMSYLVDELNGATPKEFTELLFNREYGDWTEDYSKFTGRDPDTIKAEIEELKKEASQFNTMEEWFRYVNEYEEALKKRKKEKKGITLSTFHGAKGLEWENVYIIDAEEKITPYFKAVKDAEMEEERRMFYVAITRAKNYLGIFFERPSRFVREMEGEQKSGKQTGQPEKDDRPKVTCSVKKPFRKKVS